MSAPSVAPDLEAYYQDAAAWDRDRVASWKRDARRAWQVAAAAVFCAIVSCASLLVMIPLKRTEPYVVRVDNSTGVVDVVPVYPGSQTLPEAVTRYFLAHYVSICERFNYSTAESDYEECGAFHAARRNQAWSALWTRDNPGSPLNQHKDGSEVAVQIESLSFFKRASGVEDLAQVRYVKVELPAGARTGRTSHWLATIQYMYASPSSDPGIRRWNPLGFKVVDFVPEPEVLHEQDPASTAPTRAHQ